MHSSREEKYMSSNLKEIKSYIKLEGDNVLLIFKIDEGNSIELDFTDESQVNIKNFFSKLLVEITKNPIAISFDKQDGNDLYNNVAEEYITRLNSEIEDIQSELEWDWN